MAREALCCSLQGRELPVIRLAVAPQLKKSAIFVTGRVHPGESVSSFAVEGLIKFLLSDHPQSKALRDHFEFHIVPMLNPDGVVLGNYRFSASGHDLNRKWNAPLAHLHPEIFHAKSYFLHLSKVAHIAYVLDFHGHSRRHGYFFYGCSDDTLASQISAQLLPFIISQKSQMFAIQNCNYKMMTKDREGT